MKKRVFCCMILTLFLSSIIFIGGQFKIEAYTNKYKSSKTRTYKKIKSAKTQEAAPVLAQPPAQSSPSTPNVTTLDNAVESKNYFLDRDVSLHGVFSGDRMYFSTERFWNLKSAYATLIFTQSQTISSEDISTLTVYLNDSPIYSASLVGRTKYKDSISFSIPTDSIKSGTNELRFQVYRRLSKKPCSDDVNNANWITFYGQSFVHVDLTEKSPENLISDFPYPFIRGSGETNINSIFVIPDDCKNEEIGAALVLSSSFGERKNNQDINLALQKYSKVNLSTAGNIIYIGTTKDTPKEILSLLSDDELDGARKKALIKICDSPFQSGKKLMCIISDNKNSMMDKAARLLCNDELVYQIKDDSYIVDSNIDVYTKAQIVDDKLTFEGLGYSGIMLKGPFKQQSVIGVKLPQNRVLNEGGKIDLAFRYSKNLDFKKSLLSVYINDIPIGSKDLQMSSADNDTLELKIPNDVIKSSYYEIKIVFDLELPDSYCTFREEDMPWAYIEKDSYVFLPSNQKQKVLFENYPSPFIKDGQWNDCMLVFPDNPSDEELNSAANIIAYMASEIKTNRGNLKVIKASDFSKDYSTNELIIIGTPGENKLVKDVNKNLWFKYDGAFKNFVSNEKKEFIDNYASSISSLELIDSPFDSRYSTMVLTAPSSQNLNSALKYLYTSKLKNKLNGDCSLIDSTGNVENFYFKVYKSNNITKSFNTADTKVKVFIVFFASVILLIILSLVLYIKKQRNN